MSVPIWQKKRFFLFLATITSFFGDTVMYWQGDVRVSVRPRKLLLELGSVALLFLFASLNPYSKRFPMSATVFLSRSGRCAGRVPLSLPLFGCPPGRGGKAAGEGGAGLAKSGKRRYLKTQEGRQVREHSPPCVGHVPRISRIQF